MPSMEEFIGQDDLWPLLPLPLPEPVHWKKIRSCRLRARQKFRLQAWRVTRSMVKVINAMHHGFVDTSLTSPSTDINGSRMKVTVARSLALQRLLSRGADVARARRGCNLTGVRDSVASLLKAPLDEQGYLRLSTVKQVPLIADLVVEPEDTGFVNMLDVLPPDDAVYYACEDHVVDREGKCELLFKEIEAQYGFIGGTLQEYIKYLHRPDVQHLWSWSEMSQIRAVAGVSTVLKKDGLHQRKLIMQVASNYVFQDPRDRAELGMGGGASLARCFVSNDRMSVAACDEDSAFTYVKVPDWMTAWQAGPPVLACQVWQLLGKEVQHRIRYPEQEYVAPRYLRLAMGGSHSVYLLMRINLYHTGKALLEYSTRLAWERGSAEPSEEHVTQTTCAESDGCESEQLSDVEWATRQQMRRNNPTTHDGYTVDQWCRAVREAKRLDYRVIVVVHMFAGERRTNDIQECLESLMGDNMHQLLMLSVDLAVDPQWDFTNPVTYHKMMQLARGGLIDIWLGGPPCSTVARSRHVYIKNGPRLLRFRWCIWGRPDLDGQNVLELKKQTGCGSIFGQWEMKCAVMVVHISWSIRQTRDNLHTQAFGFYLRCWGLRVDQEPSAR